MSKHTFCPAQSLWEALADSRSHKDIFVTNQCNLLHFHIIDAKCDHGNSHMLSQEFQYVSWNTLELQAPRGDWAQTVLCNGPD